MTVTPADLNRFTARFGNAGRALSRMIRPAVMPVHGKRLLVADYSQIEARVLPWLSDSPGGEAKLDIFRRTDVDPDAPDVYKIAAAETYGIDPGDVSKPQRQEGKVQELSLGFAGGAGALIRMAANYRMALTAARAQQLVDAWRQNNQWAVTFWAELWEAFEHALDRPGTERRAGRVVYIYDRDYLGGTMFCALPDGRLLSYPMLRHAEVTKTDRFGNEETKRQLTYMSQGRRKVVWKGILAENITQAAAASLLRAKIVEIERCHLLEDFLIAHVHDELIGENTEDDETAAAAILKQIMEAPLPWTGGLPLRAEVDIQTWYTKVE